MILNLHQIDAFSDALFAGNPAAVVQLGEWLPDALLQQISEENNLSETAFYTSTLPEEVVKPSTDPSYHLRWFTPAIEVDLCGHATLATAAHLFEDRHPNAGRINFWTRSGWLVAERVDNGSIAIDFPVEHPNPVVPEKSVVHALGTPIQDSYAATDLIFVLGNEEQVRTLDPDFSALSALDVRGVVVTAVSNRPDVDFVSRWFGARAGVKEDPVTGSAHVQLAPLWAERLGKRTLVARQLSARGGIVLCEVAPHHVRLTGSYRRYLNGHITIDKPR